MLVGSDSNKALSFTGRACASDKSTLEQLQVTQQRDGDQLRIDIGGHSHFSFDLFGSSHADLGACSRAMLLP
ncbi:MAG: hypothetical protein EPN58_15465 [Rhodanobacter sp.]|nr:MAG: hypothetical protein EPN58_15465 [Rhodanobacter sp.]